MEKLETGTNQGKGPREAEKPPSQSYRAEYFIGSVQAVAETGEIVVASASGSQIPAYAFNSRNVVWVVGAQKIVRNLEEALRRVREHALPLETARMKSQGYPGSMIGKIIDSREGATPIRATPYDDSCKRKTRLLKRTDASVV